MTKKKFETWNLQKKYDQREVRNKKLAEVQIFII